MTPREIVARIVKEAVLSASVEVPDALADIRATARVFFHMKSKGMIA